MFAVFFFLLVQAGPHTEAARSLEMGMSRSQVIALVGEPDWAIQPTDGGEEAQELREFAPGIALELYWENSPCEPVTAQFNGSMRLTGWSEGRAMCGVDYDWSKPERYSCENADRQSLCSQ